MREMAEALNLKINYQFIPSWIIVLSESTMEQFNQFCPGFMFIGRKTQPFGN